MQEELLVRHCSPTLAGLKTANMFMCAYENEEELRCDLCGFNRVFCKKGLRALPLKYKDGKALVYIYRPMKLQDDLSSSEAGAVLESCGYSCGHPGRCLSHLIERLKKCEDFPHEIGLFLGYPPEDVTGFIENKKCRLTGFWKVYGDTKKAEKLFAQFRKCIDVYYSCWSEGCPIERLTVAQK